MSRSNARVEKLSRAAPMSIAAGSKPWAKKRSIEPDCSSICRRIHSSAITSSPRIQRCTMARIAAGAASGSKRRTNAAGLGPTAANNVSMELRTLATRPNASAAAQKPAISRSAGSVNGRTFWIGSLAASIRL